ncbi:MAG: hypothetical protein V4654_13120 [Bdellovibrionota bacterium]
MNKQKAEKTYAKNREDKKINRSRRTEFISILASELSFRRTKDMHYSLRQFAADIDLNPMHLSNILKNKRGLSRKKAEIISRKFNLSHAERRRFHLLVSATSARSKFARNLATLGLKNDLIREKMKNKISNLK